MINIQEIVDNLLIPGKFPPPTYCQYFGSDFPASLQSSYKVAWRLYLHPLYSYSRIGWESDKFQGQNKICCLDLIITRLNIYVETTPSNLEKFIWSNNLRGGFSGVILDEWQKFVSTELPKWFNLANELVPMNCF